MWTRPPEREREAACTFVYVCVLRKKKQHSEGQRSESGNCSSNINLTEVTIEA